MEQTHQTQTRESPPQHSPTQTNSAREAVFAVALAFGVAGLLCWSVPVIAYYMPLALGGGGLAAAIAGYTTRGTGHPWYAWVAVAASILAIVIGIGGYSEFSAYQDRLERFQTQPAFP